MNIREKWEEHERNTLSEFATLSCESLGRDREEKQCDIRTVFQRDRDRIIHAKAFRRLEHKTQVFISPEGDHYRTRLTHTLEVAQIGRTLARALRLNEDLTEAIALGHDIGHTPFGHSGEKALDEITTCGFKHYEQSIRVVEKLENKGLGLNLTKEVRDGILNHPTKGRPSTLEGKVIRLADKIAYINHDIDDAIRANILTDDDLPKDIVAVLGATVRDRINNIIHDIVKHSTGVNDVIMSDDMYKAMQSLRTYMFKNVYLGSRAKEETGKAENMVKQLYSYYMENMDELPSEFRINGCGERQVIDYIAGMTDRYSINMYKNLFIPESWRG